VILSLITVGVALAIAGIGGPIFLRAFPDENVVRLFRMVYAYVAPAAVLLALSVSVKSLHWLLFVAIAVLVVGALLVRRKADRMTERG